MGRLFKSGLDYFPLDTKMDDEIELIESEHGVKGFGVLIKIYQKIYASNYWLNWDKKTVIMFSNRINVDINEVNDIINSCLEWGIFDKSIFDQYSVLTSTGIQKRYFEIIKRRKEVKVTKEILLVDYSLYLDESKINVNINSINDYISTQSKVKEKKGKGKEKKVPPQDELAEQAEDFYLTKKGKKLSGKRLESFLQFWEAFGYKRGKADAADSWLAIPTLTSALVKQICDAAKVESSNRSKIIANGATPIFPQGWLTARRWEDEQTPLTSSNSNELPKELS